MFVVNWQIETWTSARVMWLVRAFVLRCLATNTMFVARYVPGLQTGLLMLCLDSRWSVSISWLPIGPSGSGPLAPQDTRGYLDHVGPIDPKELLKEDE